jgi:hypothetical protein
LELGHRPPGRPPGPYQGNGPAPPGRTYQGSHRTKAHGDRSGYYRKSAAAVAQRRAELAAERRIRQYTEELFAWMHGLADQDPPTPPEGSSADAGASAEEVQ